MTRFSRLRTLALLLFAATPVRVFAQAAWEYTPYQIRVWIALEPTPQLPPALIATLADGVTARSDTVLGAVVQTKVTAAPAKLRSVMLKDVESALAEAITAAANRDDLEADKIYLAAVTMRSGAPSVRVR